MHLGVNLAYFAGVNLVLLVFWMSPVAVAFIQHKKIRWSILVICLLFFGFGMADQLGLHPITVFGYEPDWSGLIRVAGWLAWLWS